MEPVLANEEDFLKFDPSDEEVKEVKSNSDKNKHKSGFNNKTPWVKNSLRIQNSAIKLHYEIIEFYDFICPKPNQIEERKQIVNRVEQFVKVNLTRQNYPMLVLVYLVLFLPTCSYLIVILTW
jgi:DNA polymerase sigma